MPRATSVSMVAVWASRARQRSAQEGEAAHQEHRRRQSHRQILEIAHLRAGVVSDRIARVELGQIDHHDLHPEGGRDYELKKDAFLPLFDGSFLAIGEEMSVVAESFELGEELLGIGLGRVVADAASFGGEADIHTPHPLLMPKQRFSRRRATGAPHAREGEVGRFPGADERAQRRAARRGPR